MTQFTGTIEEVATKEVTTKFGVKPTFSMKVSGNWVKCGFKRPPGNVGDEISYEGTSGTYGLEGKDIIILKKGAGVAGGTYTTAIPITKAPVSSGGYGKDRVFPIPPLHGDRSIVRQNALARSTELYIGARGGKPFELTEESVDIVIKIARSFEAYTAGDLDRASAEAEMKAPTPPAEDVPA